MTRRRGNRARWSWRVAGGDSGRADLNCNKKRKGIVDAPRASVDPVSGCSSAWSTDYSLTGPEGAAAVAAGLVDAEWYRPPSTLTGYAV